MIIECAVNIDETRRRAGREAHGARQRDVEHRVLVTVAPAALQHFHRAGDADGHPLGQLVVHPVSDTLGRPSGVPRAPHDLAGLRLNPRVGSLYEWLAHEVLGERRIRGGQAVLRLEAPGRLAAHDERVALELLPAAAQIEAVEIHSAEPHAELVHGLTGQLSVGRDCRLPDEIAAQRLAQCGSVAAAEVLERYLERRALHREPDRRGCPHDLSHVVDPRFELEAAHSLRHSPRVERIPLDGHPDSQLLVERCGVGDD